MSCCDSESLTQTTLTRVLLPASLTGDHKAAVYSSLTALFHNIPAKSVAEFIRNVKYPMDDPAKKAIAGYPQDMWMPMDEMFVKPETFGLRKGWSGAMMGMMTMVRVLPPVLYDEIQRRKQAASGVRA